MWKHPPGDEIYRKGNISVFEVDGKKNKVKERCTARPDLLSQEVQESFGPKARTSWMFSCPNETPQTLLTAQTCRKLLYRAPCTCSASYSAPLQPEVHFLPIFVRECKTPITNEKEICLCEISQLCFL